MNNSYKLVYSEALNAWVAVAEHVSSRGKKGTVRLLVALNLIAAGAFGGLDGGVAWAAPPALTQLPTGAQVAAGTVSISQTQTATAASMAIAQSSNQAIVNWQSFNVGANAKVNITQPSSTSVLLNRVQSSNPSQIFGQITANGQVMLVNSSGVYFAPGSSVDVGSFTATTHSISDTDFLKGNYNFNRNGATGSIVNEGSLKASLGGYIALLAPEVRNQGVVLAQMGGTAALAAGESFQLQFGSNNQLTNVLVTPATIQTLVDNGNAVQAPGGLIILSAQAANGLLGGVVKNSGAISATGLVSDGGTIRLSASHKIELAQSSSISADAAPGSAGKGGRIDIIADLGNATSTTQVDGTISAKGGELGGDGGFVETSATDLRIADSTRVSTLAPQGQAGNWLLDPNDFEVSSTGNISGSALSTLLASGNVTLQAGTGSDTDTVPLASKFGNTPTTGAKGDINIYDAVSWSAYTLTLNAGYNINVGSSTKTGSLTVTGTGALVLNPSSGSVTGKTANGMVLMGMASTPTGGLNSTGFNGQINASTSGVITIGVNAYTVLSSEADFVKLSSSGKYVLGSNLSFSTPYTAAVVASFSGTLDGFGHVISGLNINNSSAASNVGLFASSNGKVSNIGVAGSVVGANGVGAIAGFTNGLVISRSYSTVAVTGANWVGGLVGLGQPVTVSESYATGEVRSNNNGGGSLGGLVGYLYGGSITSSYATSAVYGAASAGGLVGSMQNNSNISTSFATGDVTAMVSSKSDFGGLVGYVPASAGVTINNSYATGALKLNTSVTNITSRGGLIGSVYSAVISSLGVGSNYWNSSANPDLNTTTGGTGSGAANGVSSLTASQLKSASNFSSGFGNTAGLFTASSGWGYQTGVNGGFPVRCSITLCAAYDSSLIALTFNGSSGGAWSVASNWLINGKGVAPGFGPTSAYVDSIAGFTIGSSVTVNYDTQNVGSVSNNIVTAGTISFSGTANVALGGVISGAGTIVQNSTGTVTLSGANSYTGGTTVSAGKLVANHASALGTGAVAIGSAGTLDLTVSGTVALASTLVMDAGAAISNSANTSALSVAGTSTLAGNIKTAGSQSYEGAVTLGAASILSTVNSSNVNTNANVNFGSSVDGPYALTITNGSGNVSFGRTVGASAPLASLTVTGGLTTTAQTTTLGGNVTTVGSQIYGGNLTLGSNTVLTSANSDVTIAGNINTVSAGAGFLYLLDSGSYSFAGTTYTNTDAATSYTVNLTGLGSLSYFGSLTQKESTFTFTPSSSYNANFLIVAGGGAGGGDGGGGGGAGGLVTNNGNLLSQFGITSGTNYSIVVGKGGTLVNGTNSVAANIGNGYISSAFGYTALGGGWGDRKDGNFALNTGGSGGGHRSAYGLGVFAASTQFSTYGYGLGNAGGADSGGSSWGSGGGGAGSAGSNVSTGNGGAAYQWIDGKYYAGGGGGARGDGTNGLGGNTATTAQKGGAGDGSTTNAKYGWNAVAGTGGGGGGSNVNDYSVSQTDPLAQSAGGSGVVGVSYSLNNAYSLAINSGSGKSTIGGSVSNISTLTVNSTSSASSISGAIGGSTALVKSGAGGVLTLSGTNTYTGATTVSAGTLAVTNVAGLGANSAGTTVASGATLDLRNVAIDAEAITLNGGTIATSTGTSSLPGAVTLGASSALNVTGTQLTLSGVVTSPTYGLALLGTGSIVLNNTANTLSTIATGSGVSALSVVNGSALTIGQVTTGGTTYSGISSTDTVAVETRSGDLTVSQSVSTTSTSFNTSAPALKLSAGSTTAAGTSTGGNIVLSGSPNFLVGTGGISVFYSGSASSSSGLALANALSSKTTKYVLYNESTSNLPSSGAGYYALFRESPTRVYLLPVSGQSSTYGTAPTALNYCFSSSASACSYLSVSGIPGAAQSFSLASSAVTSIVSVTSGVTGSLLLSGPAAVASGMTATTHAGTYGLSLVPSLTLSGYLFSSGNAVNYTVDKANLVVSATPSLTGNVYNSSAFTGSYTTTAVNGETFTVTGQASGTNAGTYTSALNVSGSALVNYNTPVLSNANLVITPRPVTVSNTSRSTTYDGVASYASLASGTAASATSADTAPSGTGLVGADALASVTQTSSGYSGADSGVAQAGSFTVTPSAAVLSTGNAGNYSFSYGDSTHTVDKANLAVSATPSLSGNVYKGAAFTGSYTTTAVNGETFTVTGQASGTDAGTYTSALNVSGSALVNYNTPVLSNANLVISPRPVTVSNANRNTPYDGVASYASLASGTAASATSAATAPSGTGLVGSDALASVTLTSSGYSGADSGVAQAGSFTVTPSAAVLSTGNAGNYSFSYGDSTHTVDKANATVTANSGTLTYNGVNQTITGFTVSGLVGAETVAVLTGVNASRTEKNAGTYATSASGTDGNYNLSFVPGSMFINKAALTATGNSAAVTYNGANQSATGFTVAGLQGTDTVADLSSLVAAGATAKNTGSYTNAVSAGTEANYTVSTVDGSLAIAKANATVTANSGTLTYNGANQTVTGFTATGLVGVELVTGLTGVNASRTEKNAGSYATAASGTDGNYNLSFVPGSMLINKAALTVSALNDSKTYDTNAYAGGAGASYTGLVNNETAAVLSGTLAYSGSSQGAKNAGTYVITPGGLSSSNYTMSFADGALTVNPAPLVITAQTNTKSFDGNASAVVLPVVSGLRGADAVTNLSEVYADMNPGNGKTLSVKTDYLVQDGNSGANYAVTLLADTSGVIRALPVAVLPPTTAASSTNYTPPQLQVATSSTAATSSSSAGSTATAGSSPGVSVNTINQAAQQLPGLVTVLVPGGTATAGTGLVISLPEAVIAPAQQAALSVSVSMADNQPLPAWIRYEPSTQSLVTGAVPAGAFPISVLVRVGEQVTVIQISESQAAAK